jgi:galactose mutarotase-like enzyme
MEPFFSIASKEMIAGVKSKGAELCTLRARDSDTEYLWQGDSWNKHSPILFPIVGGLRNGVYEYRGKSYNLPRHGFARDREFALIEKGKERLVFALLYDESSLAVYPFQFELRVIYTIEGSKLSVTYEVKNLEENSEMLFSIGAHPAFKVPVEAGLAYDDYQLHLNLDADKEILKYNVTKDGLIDSSSAQAWPSEMILDMDKELFVSDALVYSGINSGKIVLQSPKSNKRIQLYYEGFPYLGIWAQYGAEFVCIEPWQGIADWDNTDGLLENKKGIIALAPKEVWRQSWHIIVQ